MVFCCLFSGDPVENDPRKNNPLTFKVNMMHAPCEDPGCCCISCLCPCFAQIVIRKKALNNDMKRYVCCQGYYDGLCPCFKSGSCGEPSCPMCCLCLESFCCNSCAVSSTRLLVMDERSLQPDRWDNRIIRCNNCIQALSCICDILSICVSELRDCASILRCVSNTVYLITQGCMTAQVNVELKHNPGASDVYAAPAGQMMSRV